MQSPSSGDDAVDLREYVAVLRRRWPLIVAVTSVVTLLAAAYSFSRTPVYTAKAEVLVQPASASSQFRPDQLVSLDTEARLATSAPVATIAKDTLGVDLTITELLKRVEVRVTPDTLVLDVYFTDPNAERAAAGANAFAEAYLDYKRERSVTAAAEDRREIQQEIDDLQEQLEGLEGAAEGSIEEQQALLIGSQISILTSDLVSILPESNPGEVILAAFPPQRPSSPNHPINLAMGMVLGGFLAVVLAFVRDRTDERITGRTDLELTIDAPVLAAIPTAAVPVKEGSWLVTERQPRSPAAEAYRTLRTAVMAMSRQRGLKILAIASPTLGEGKTTTTANLAVTLSQTDSRVLALSADLRRPALHRCFDRDLAIGVADVLMGEATLEDAIQRVSPNLWLLTSGRPPGRPAELLQSNRLPELLANAAKAFDFILIDCPPVLGLADTLSVAPFADAVILIARAESTKRGALLHSADQLEQVGARVRGSVLNDVTVSKRNADGYGYGYGGTGEDEIAKDAKLQESRRSRTRAAGPGDRGDDQPPAPTSPEIEGSPRRQPEPAPPPPAGARAEQ